MSGTVISLIVFAVLLGGAILGAIARHCLPDQRLDDDSKQVINLGTGLIGTIAALVLGLRAAARAIEPQTDTQRAFKSLANETVADFARTRALLFQPFSGPFEISRAPLQHALAPLGP